MDEQDLIDAEQKIYASALHALIGLLNPEQKAAVVDTVMGTASTIDKDQDRDPDVKQITRQVVNFILGNKFGTPYPWDGKEQDAEI
jgi:hypothetical protein